MLQGLSSWDSFFWIFFDELVEEIPGKGWESAEIVLEWIVVAVFVFFKDIIGIDGWEKRSTSHHYEKNDS